MEEPSAETLFTRFSRQVKQLDNLAVQATEQRRKGNLSQLSSDALYTSGLLSLHIRFELFLEDLFYSCITGKSGLDDCAPELTFSSREQASNLLFGNLNYVTWMPYGEVERISKRTFSDGAPFSRLRRHADEKSFLEELTLVRNAVAHQSAPSLKKIENLTSPMRARRRNPAGYLQYTVQGDTHFRRYCSSILIIASALTRPNISAAKRVLSPEAAYNKNDEVTKGCYLCINCAGTKNLRTKIGRLGDCSKCKKSGARTKTGWRRVY